MLPYDGWQPIKPTPIDELRRPHPEQKRIDTEFGRPAAGDGIGYLPAHVARVARRFPPIVRHAHRPLARSAEPRRRAAQSAARLTFHSVAHRTLLTGFPRNQDPSTSLGFPDDEVVEVNVCARRIECTRHEPHIAF